jgi:aspartyl-tRNA(Asn)/glutamyl-tRNA(Gln) amidotransferase subunit A
MELSRRQFLSATSGAVASLAASRQVPATPADDLAYLSIFELSELIRKKKISPVEVTRSTVHRIEMLNPILNAYITVTAEQALKSAQEAEREIQQGKWRGPLHGVPISLKDLVDTLGVKTTAGSALFKDRVPTSDAEVVRRLKAAGAVLVGKTNMHEFAYGGTSVVSHFGPVHNPWNPDYIAGGSSGGSASAVAAGMCYGSIGSDTGGSIRQPCACCGLVGLKPTYGLVSTRGAIPLSWSVDHLGPMTRTVADAAILLQVIAGYDPDEITSASIKVEDYPAGLRLPVSKIRLGIARDFFFQDLHPEIDAAAGQAIRVLEELTSGKARDVKLDPAAVDQIRITVRAAEAYAYHAAYLKTNTSLYEPYTLQRIETGAGISTPEYLQARRQLEQARRESAHIFETVDAFITPTTQIPTLSIAEVPVEPPAAIAIEKPLMRNTSPLDGYGLPTISIPCGFTRSGLPIGLQISGALGADALVLRLAHAYEQATKWHLKHPPKFA